MLIAGDLGGTKTLLGLYDPASGPRKPIAEEKYHSADYPGLTHMVSEFVLKTGVTPTAGCFDVAGPVVGGRAKLTNLPWVLEESSLAEELGLQRVTLLNDLVAAAVAVPHLTPDELHTINVGEAQLHGAVVLVAPGTGLGEAFLIWDGERYLACASEGGHHSFAPADALQTGLLAYMRERLGHVGVERVCSGSGMPNLYDFLHVSGFAHETPEFRALLAAAPDPTPVIVDAALDDPVNNPLAVATLRIFVSILGSEAGNFALKVWSTGGVYLAGGIPPRIIPQLEEGGFMEAFVDKGRFRERLTETPVHVVTANAPMLGAAIYGLELLKSV